jgi:PAS domain S-box-containing protein
MKLNITAKILLFGSLLILVFTVFLGRFFIRYEIAAIAAGLNERAATIAENLAYNSEYGLLVGDKEALARLIEGTVKGRDISYAIVENKMGEIQARAGKEGKGPTKEFAMPVVTKPLPGAKEEIGLFQDEIGKGKEEVIGKIRLGVSLAGMHRKTVSTKRYFLLVAAIVILTACLGTYLGVRCFITRPLAPLISGIEKIGKGDLSHRVEVKTHDEIGRLAVSFNQMTGALSRIMVSRDYIDNIIKSMSDVLIVSNPKGKIERVNYATLKLLGYEEKELVGQPVEMLFAEVAQTPGPGSENPSGKTLESAEGVVVEKICMARDGKKVPVLCSVSPLLSEDGKIQGIIYVAQDITKRKLMEEDLAKARDTALELARLKSDFLANMSHEIRTPMNAIIGMTGLLADTELTPHQREFVEIVRSSGDALLAIINNILDFSKIEAGKMILEKLDFNFREAVEGAVEIVGISARTKEIELLSFIAPDIPTALRGDTGWLRQILINLLGNAIKFTERGEVVLRATIESETDSFLKVRIAVSDTGIGISHDRLELLFQAFSQADATTTRKYGGTGLGLAICKKLVELMGGEIGCESAPGKGSTFWCTIPFEKQSMETVPAEPDGIVTAGIRTLIVDDNATNREILHHYLSSWKMRHDTAADGFEAIGILRREASSRDPYNLVILDRQMPGMDGITLAYEIKANPSISSTRILMLGSRDKPADSAALKQAGIGAYLMKPVRQSTLYDCIATIMGVAQTQRLDAKAIGHSKNIVLPWGRRKHFHVLVVEDNAVNQKLAILQLQKLGYKADPVENGLKALDALSRIPYDLVLMDCQMPDMDGYSATAELRKREGDSHHTPVIAMTANAMEGDREKCLAAGMDDYISKPITLEALADVFRRWDAPVDFSVLRNLCELGGEDKQGILGKVIATFLADVPLHLKTIREAAAKGNAKVLEQEFHTLKGSCGGIGAGGMRSICERLALIALSGIFADLEVNELIDALDEEFVRVSAALEEMRKDFS